MTGSRVAGPIWRDIFKRILATGDDWKMTFDIPSDIVFRDISSRTDVGLFMHWRERFVVSRTLI